MRFVDEAVITVRSGKGGAGCVSFLREKFMPRGGPDGGDGGNGGNIIVRATTRLHSLYDFRLKRLYEAQNGQSGQGSQRFGRKGEDLYIELPVGAQIFILKKGKKGELICDLKEDGDEFVLAKGGRGGKGNEFFKTSTMRAPRFAQPGEPGEEFTLGLELKILADCGFIGLPNAGKSTLISKLSAAKPKIANYPFTTLVPNLGVMLDDGNYDRRLIIADIPGLIEGAHEGVGLGIRFLKHVERTRFLVHLLSVEDISLENPWDGFALINSELMNFSEDLAHRQQLLLVNKIDLAEEGFLQALKERAEADALPIFFISAENGDGLEELVKAMWLMQDTLKINEPKEEFAGRIPRDIQRELEADDSKGLDAEREAFANYENNENGDDFDKDGPEVFYVGK